MPFISIQLNSNRPRECVAFFDNIEATAERPEDIEVLLHIDTGDTAMEKVVAQEKIRRRFNLRVLQTDLVKGYVTLWKPLNSLFPLTHPDAYFVANLFDEIRFETKGWDGILRKYKGYYPDDIFRLRTSQFRFHNYTDVWQCGFVPDSSAFYTRKWLELSGDWCPCMGPDSFQQCLAYYMYTYDPFEPRQFNRDIPVPDIAFSGEGGSIGLDGAALDNRLRDNTRLWFILMSHRMQEEACRRAMLMNSHIMADERGSEEQTVITEDRQGKCFLLHDASTGKIITVLSYRLSWTRITLRTMWRAIRFNYYCGGGYASLRDSKIRGIRMLINAYYPTGAKVLASTDRVRLGMRWRIKRMLRTAHRSKTVHKYFWFLRQPYRLYLKSRGL